MSSGADRPAGIAHAPGASPRAGLSPRRRRIRTIGIIIFVVGVVGASLTYWLETRAAELADEDMYRDAAAADTRQMGILYGQTWAKVVGWTDAAQLPTGQAALILAVSLIAAGLCLRVSTLPDDEDGPPVS